MAEHDGKTTPTSLQHANDDVVLFEDALPPQLIASVLRDADALAAAPNFWLPRAAIEAGAAAARTAAAAAVAELYSRTMAPLLPPDWAGAEYWLQAYAPGAGLRFHWDKDEALFARGGPMRHPVWSSVAYLTGGCGEGDEGAMMMQSPTVVQDQIFDAAARQPRPADPTVSVFAWPKPGRYLAFGGALSHGVLDSFDTASRRATLLVNWWRGGAPEGVGEAGEGQLLEFGIAVRPRPSEEQAQEQQQLEQQQLEQHGSSGEKRDAGTAAVDAAQDRLAGLALGAGRQAQEQPQGRAARARRVVIVELSPPPLPADGDRAILVDDLIAEAGLSLFDGRAPSKAAAAVAGLRVRHGGRSLLPLDPAHVAAQQEAAAAAGGGGEKVRRLQTAAALVPPSMLPDESSDEEEGSGSDDEG